MGYKDFKDFSEKLKKSIENINKNNMFKSEKIKYVKKAEKVEDNFLTKLVVVEELLNEIEEINETLEKFKKMETMDGGAFKYNKNAQKFLAEKNKIIFELNEEIKVLNNKLLDEIVLAYKRGKSYATFLEKDDRESFYTSYKKFESIAYDSMVNRGMIPYPTIKNNYEENYEQKKHKEKEEEINKSTETDLKLYEEMHKKLSNLETSLSMSKNFELKSQIKKEVLEIRKVISPKTIQTSKEVINKLKHSKQLVLDLEQIETITEFISAPHINFKHKDLRIRRRKTKRIAKRISNLKEYLKKAIAEEKEKTPVLSDAKQQYTESIKTATEAVSKFKSIVDDNMRLKDQQDKIVSRTSSIDEENKQLQQKIESKNKELGELNEQASKIGILFHTEEQLKQLEEINNNKSKLLDEIKEAEDRIKENKKFKEEKLKEKPIMGIPSEYQYMKGKLNEIGNLNKLNQKMKSELRK